MADHKTLANDELHEPKHIQTATNASDAGKAILAKGDGTSVLRKLSLTDLEETLDIVYVSTEADFPDQVLGYIPLLPDTAYIITTDVAVSFPLQYTATTFIDGINSGLASLTYVGVIPFINNLTSEPDLRIDNLTINCPNSPLFAVSDVANAGNIRFESCDVVAASLGILTNVAQFQFNQTELILSITGAEFAGVATTPIVNITNNISTMMAGVFLNIENIIIAGGRIEFAQIVQGGATPVTAIRSTGAANVTAGSLMNVSTCLFAVDAPLAGGVTTQSARWNFLNALPLQDSQLAATAYLQTPETVTISVISQHEQILGGNWQSIQFTEAIDVDADGIVTYNGERPLAASVIATATVEKVGGGADEIEAVLAQNGVVLPYTVGATQNPTPTQVTCAAIIQLVPGDTIEMQVANNTSTSDIVVNLANITGTRVP